METEKNGGFIFLQRELLVQVFTTQSTTRGEREWGPRVGRGSGGRAWGEGVEAAHGEREWRPCVGRGSGGGYLIWLCHGGGTVSR